jgi:hypothetical protein
LQALCKVNGVQFTVELSSYGGRRVREQVQNCVIADFISRGKYFDFISRGKCITWKLVRGRDTQFADIAVIFIRKHAHLSRAQKLDFQYKCSSGQVYLKIMVFLPTSSVVKGLNLTLASNV